MRADELDFFSLVELRPNEGAIEFCGRRAILLHTDAMGALRKELVETLGAEAAKVVLTRYGFSCGHEDAGLLAAYMHPDTIEQFVRGGPRTHMFAGIAEVETRSVEIDCERRRYRMGGFWRRSYEAEQHLRLFGRSHEAVCWTLAGYASGFASFVFQTDMICIEHECEGSGAERCSWTLMNADDCTPELAELRKYFQPLNIKDQIDGLETKVFERTRELEASEQRYRNLIEDLPEIVFALHLSGRLVQLNKAGRTRLGIDEAELPSLRLKDLVLPEYRAQASSFLKHSAQQRSVARLDVVMSDSAGNPFPVQLQVEPVIKGDKIVGYSGLALDVTAQHERERKLTEYAARLENREQQIQDIINDAVYILDLDGRLSFVNTRMADLLGVPADRAIGRRCGEFMLHSSALRLERDFRRRLAGGPGLPFEIAIEAPCGTNCLLEVSTAVLLTNGKAEGVIGVARDITARREMERQLAQANRLSSLGQFASGIAHEINNPLGLVSGFAEELQSLMEAIPNAAQIPDLEIIRDGLTTIQEQAQRCKAITDNLLLFSRRQSPPIEPVDVALYVQERFASYREVGLTRGLEITFDIEDRLPPVRTNPTLLDQVIQNLVKNARDAMNGAGPLRVELRSADDAVELGVLDEGAGLPAGVIDHVFDPFFTTKPPGRGTGLGLSICYGIMSELHGRITCGNRQEGGAWFRISLPYDEAGIEGAD
ncbi:Hybrid sensor component of two-component regulation system [Aromatoleum aromaticum EbN1]|uniref:histidine kinase n=1 Tax=Aromatoleum aromaticum (strain DSM 19018 / LMG 30748 / EbN1) TaxID=76114 RepID=Q5P0J1_AROAE|nr:XylR N-terminal domain-containing protein [Aromatoleum aromaticum]CAI09173.1 Hybrid sensor component of two-component regulation system [Aromatoleum aromaticum EbN1]